MSTASLDTANMSFGEINSSSSQLLTSTCQLQSFNGGHLEFCMIIKSNKCIVCFFACLDSENIWLGEIILSLSKLLTTI